MLTRRSVRTFLFIWGAGIVIEVLAWLYLPGYPLWLVPLVALPVWVVCERTLGRSQWFGFFAVTIASVVVGGAFVQWFWPHYAAPAVPAVLAAVAISVHRASIRARVPAERCGLALLLVLVVHVAVALLLHGDTEQPGSRTSVTRDLAQKGGEHLVFVQYDSDYTLHREWVYNAADMAAAPVIFAHDLGADRNPALVALYPNRSVWLLHVSLRKTQLEPYPSG